VRLQPQKYNPLGFQLDEPSSWFVVVMLTLGVFVGTGRRWFFYPAWLLTLVSLGTSNVYV
jgi:hypothetical protein